MVFTENNHLASVFGAAGTYFRSGKYLENFIDYLRASESRKLRKAFKKTTRKKVSFNLLSAMSLRFADFASEEVQEFKNNRLPEMQRESEQPARVTFNNSNSEKSSSSRNIVVTKKLDKTIETAGEQKPGMNLGIVIFVFRILIQKQFFWNVLKRPTF